MRKSIEKPKAPVYHRQRLLLFFLEAAKSGLSKRDLQKLDYVNADGDISNYYPDFIVKLTDGRVVIVETKGQEDLDVPHKMARLAQWCDDINAVVSGTEYKFVFVGDGKFEKYRPGSFFELLELHRKYKPR